VDLNRDGVVSILDLILAAQAIGGTTTSAAPVALNPDLIRAGDMCIANYCDRDL
jgi:hypothetical protein